MRVNRGQIFNFMDTNGRRKDVVNAMSVYLRCLDETYEELGTHDWNRFPNNLTQYVFYQKAVKYSPEVFKTHPKYDDVKDMIDGNQLGEAFSMCRESDVKEVLGDGYGSFMDTLDVGVEKRARHYTNTLMKLGFVDRARQFTGVGKTVLRGDNVVRDDIEEILPIDDVNLIYLRQLLKLRIYTDDESGAFYSPVILAIYILLKYDRVPKEFFESIVQSLSPYAPVEHVDEFLESYFAGDGEFGDMEIPASFLRNDKLDDSVLREYFRNTKSSQSVDVYVKYYGLLYDFVEKRDGDALDALLDFYGENKAMINKAFGYGKNIFNLTAYQCVDEFLANNAYVEFLSGTEDFNAKIYRLYHFSKLYDNIKEYSDTTIRLLSVTGIFKFKNGFAELEYRQIFEEIFKHVNIDRCVFGVQSLAEYEEGAYSYFGTNVPLISILNIRDDVTSILDALNGVYHTDEFTQIKGFLSSEKQDAFRKFIEGEYPPEEARRLLAMFKDRSNDNQIKKRVNPTADVPTIFEYVVGISWYYLSDRNFDLLDSFNLTLDADFLPVTHAAGGDGDIVIQYDNCTVMLEVTLMNAFAQKRGEWEPVLRHTINLAARSNAKDVVTFFIADTLDVNTVNIWRAVSIFGLQATDGSGDFVDNVRIMPLRTDEIIEFMDKSVGTDSIIAGALESYRKLWESVKLDEQETNWREIYIGSLLGGGEK